MAISAAPIPCDRQRRFDRACTALAALCPGRARRVSDFKIAPRARMDPLDIERARWLVHAMGLARGTEGGEALARLARLGYAVSSQPGGPWRPQPIIPLDTEGLLYLGHVLPNRSVRWKRMEAIALSVDPITLPPRVWCSAHETLQVQAALRAEGHELD